MAFEKRTLAASTVRLGRATLAGLVVTTVFTFVATNIPVAPLGASSPAQVYVSEPFTNANVQVPADWLLPVTSGGGNVACMTASTNVAQTPIPGCNLTTPDAPGSGTLRLTGSTTNQNGGIAYASTIPSGQGVDVSFNTYQYGGTGADGISFFLAGTDPASPAPFASLGPAGGHLGYSGGTAAPAGNGLANGYLGIGFDVFGNFTNKQYEGSGCTDPSWAGNTHSSSTTDATTTSARACTRRHIPAIPHQDNDSAR